MKIGFFDSGLGGMTVLSRFIAEIPNNDYYYLGDNDNAPFGDKSYEELKKIFDKNTEMFLKEKIKNVVCACNTMSTNILKGKKTIYNGITFFPIVPHIDFLLLSSGQCDVFCTKNTAKFLQKSTNNIPNLRIFACKGLVELIEKKELDYSSLKPYIPKNRENVNQVVLGCTHYPIVKSVFRKFYPNCVFTDNVSHVIKQFNQSSSSGTVTFLGNNRIFNSSRFIEIYKKINDFGKNLPKVVDNYQKWLYNIHTQSSKGGSLT